VKQEKDMEGDWLALENYRKEIDRIDEKIIPLLLKRQDIAASIGKLKSTLGLDIFNPAREIEVIRRLSSANTKNLPREAVRHIFCEIISAARSVQGAFKVAYLGPKATFTHQAAISLFGRSTSFKSADTIEEVFGLVEKGICLHGVVPIENSYEGAVNSTLDLLYKFELKIGAEIFLRIRHHLLSRSKDIRELKQLYSHPMAIAQCRSWINKNLPSIPVKEMESTAYAAEMACEEPGAAAIAGRLSGLNYDLPVLCENIEDHPDNVTRFLVIGKTDSEPTGKDKTSILFSLSHRPGALYRVLKSLADKNINMTRIESRPMKRRNWEYLFFVDLEGHEQEKKLADAITEMEGQCDFMKHLGSYPAGEEPWD